ncbi:MAG: radical SAM protein [Thermoplasmata archaeon]
MIFDFIMSRFGISNRKDFGRIFFVISKIFPIDRPDLALKRSRNILFSFFGWRFGFKGDIRPSILQLETVSGCNFNCIMCRAGDLKKEFMNYEDFKKIFDRFPEVFVVIMNLSGEPFLSKYTIDMIRYASFEAKAIVNIFSNFSILPHPEEVINSGLYEIHASIDTFNESKFSRIREGGKLERVLSNLENLVMFKKKNGKLLPIISINAVLSEETIEDAEDIILNAIRIGVDRVKFQRLLFDLPDLHVPSESSQKYMLLLKEKYKERICVVLNNFENVGEKAKGYCYLAYFMSAVKVNGDIYPCCMPYPFFYPQESIMGNVFHDFAKYYLKRKRFVGNFRKSPPKFCKQCPIYFRV